MITWWLWTWILGQRMTCGGGGYIRARKLTELGNMRLRVELRLNSLEEIERWVLSFGTHCTVVGPAELKERIGEIARELARRCQS